MSRRKPDMVLDPSDSDGEALPCGCSLEYFDTGDGGATSFTFCDTHRHCGRIWIAKPGKK